MEFQRVRGGLRNVEEDLRAILGNLGNLGSDGVLGEFLLLPGNSKRPQERFKGSQGSFMKSHGVLAGTRRSQWRFR